MHAEPDCLIIGGGIAGLWTLRELVARGYDAALLETAALGSGQSIASQGILHAGTKYALTGSASEASKAAGAAAARWRLAMRGEGPIDLSGVRVLSPRTHMFTTPGIASRLSGLAASKALVSGPTRLDRAEFPGALLEAPEGVDVYSLDEPVIHTGSALEEIAAPVRDRVLLANEISLGWRGAGSAGRHAEVVARHGPAEARFSPRALVLCAGSANEALLASLGIDSDIRMQRRPLHMVMARSASLPPLNAHCVTLSDKPRATITSAADAAGRTVWYIGGQLAETGVRRSRDAQIEEARRELGQILPWIDLADAEWASLAIDRAEGLNDHGKRPDAPVVRSVANVVACWPTKLVLAPLAADAVAETLERTLRVEPSHERRPLPGGPDTPPVALPPWEREDVSWI